MHLLRLKPSPGAHRAVTGHRGCDLHQTPLQRQCLVPLAHMLGKIANEARAVDFAKERGRFAQSPGARTERFNDQAIARELPSMANEALDVGFIELDDFGNEKDLCRHTPLADRLLQSLINDPFMRGVLIDDYQAVLGLRYDISVMNLGARRSERMIEQRAVARLLFRARNDAAGKIAAQVCGRGADGKSRLRWCGEAATKRCECRT